MNHPINSLKNLKDSGSLRKKKVSIHQSNHLFNEVHQELLVTLIFSITVLNNCSGIEYEQFYENRSKSAWSVSSDQHYLYSWTIKSDLHLKDIPNDDMDCPQSKHNWVLSEVEIIMNPSTTLLTLTEKSIPHFVNQ